jgi:ATP-binding cassette subfamily C protein LapB
VRKPVILQLEEDGELMLLESLDADGLVTYWLSNGGDLVREEPLETLLTRVKPDAVMLGIATRGRDSRIDDFTRPLEAHWFWQHFHTGRNCQRLRWRPSLATYCWGDPFSHAGLRPCHSAQSFPTLWVLFFGVLFAAAFEYFHPPGANPCFRHHKCYILIWKVSSLFFARAMAIKNDARPNPPAPLFRNYVNWTRCASC